jgi:hypothetical protein
MPAKPTALITQQFRQHNTDLFLASANSHNYYIFWGRPLIWPNGDVVPTTLDNVGNTTFDYWRDIIGAKRVVPGTIHYVIPRYDWTTSTIYQMYDHRNANLYAQTFFVITANNQVYKCLHNNNGGASTVVPTGTSNNILTTADGYIWKFMYDISAGDLLAYETSRYIPVKVLTSDDGRAQWPVQNYGTLSTSNGSLDVIVVANGGTNYFPGNTTVTIAGDGTGATASATVTANVITSITVTARGKDYSWATATVHGSGTGANAVVMIPPRPSHGANAVTELGGAALMFAATFANTESGAFPVTGPWGTVDYRRIGLLADPLYANGVAANTSSPVRQTLDLTLTPVVIGWTADDTVTGQTSGATATVIDWNALDNANKLRTVSANGVFVQGEHVIGSPSGAEGVITVITQPTLKPFTGQMLYVQQRGLTSRANTQTEEVRIVIHF